MKLRHENIVDAKDIIYSSNNIYVVMDLCLDGDLRSMLTNNGHRLPEWESIKILF